MSGIINADAVNSLGETVEYSCCLASSVKNPGSFREIALSKINLLNYDETIEQIIEFFDIKIEYNFTEVEDLFQLENYEKYFELKMLKSIIFDAINHVADKIELGRVAVCQNPLGGIILIFSSQDSLNLEGDGMTHYYLDLIEMSGILK